jgi:dGTPase
LRLYSTKGWGREVSNDGSPQDPWRSEIDRDYGRIIHCASFRRLQGKTQVFPGHESDFFRNRLTHSLEVAQIAEGIAQRLNFVCPELKTERISERLCAAAALVHDIGHPPFGHNGEQALDEAMRRFGGFEGNAQTLRIITKLEKKVQREAPTDGDLRAGLNLTYRVLGAVLKYDDPIPTKRSKQAKLKKGYYTTEANLVRRLKRAICPTYHGRRFKTVECWIMDVADDIAYSTYDLEDSLKAGFLTPASILASKEDLLNRVADKVSKELKESFSAEMVLITFSEIFSNLTSAADPQEDPLVNLVLGYQSSETLAQSGYLRTKLSTQLVHEAINSVELKYNSRFPMLSTVALSSNSRRKVEVLKQYTFEAMVYSARVKLPEFRGQGVVSTIFKALASERGFLLMPEDVREQYVKQKPKSTAAMRIICDFVAGMTDRYAVEFYARLHSDGAQSIFKPI